MKVFVMDLLPYGQHFDEFKAGRFIPYPLPGKYFDPGIAARTYDEHFEVWAEMDALGFDGLGLNEHHTTPHGLMVSPNMIAAAAARTTKRLEFLILGNLIPLHNPLRIAEELAMADCMSHGRVLPGFARGVPREYRVYDVPMSQSRARFDEALEIIKKAWTEDVFSFEGKFWKYKDISIWPRPVQRPHPPLYIPFTGSKETIELAGRLNLNAVMPAGHPGVTQDIVAYFDRQLAANGHTLTSDQMTLFTDAYVAEDSETALKEYGPYYLYFVQTLWHHGSDQSNETLGKAGYVNTSSFDYIRPENQPFAQLDRAKIRQTTLPDVERRVKEGQLAFGSPKEVADRLIGMAEGMGANRILLNLNLGALPHEMFLEQIRRFGREVLPRLQAHQVKRVPTGARVEA
jgi:alkanesulfonate monooxygenase SsuD/methylene tetrahydromethanopterin reductase-like flavin-dependent oxidoreductase (luciferase family)